MSRLKENDVIDFQVGDLLTRFGVSNPDVYGVRRERSKDAGIVMSIYSYMSSARYDCEEDPEEKERKRVQIHGSDH